MTHIRTTRLLLAVFALGIVSSQPAGAYVGPSYMQIPGLHGGAKSKLFGDWFRFTANQWQRGSGPGGGGPGRGGGAGGPGRGGPPGGDGAAGANAAGAGAAALNLGNIPGGGTQPRAPYVGATAPVQGKGELVITVDKKAPAFAKLMAMCGASAPIPEVTYAESAERARGQLALGERPADVPEYLKYKFKNVRFSDCPIVDDAPEQAIFVTFEDVQWLNYDRTKATPFVAKVADLGPKETSGVTKAFVVTWFAAANDVSDDQCPAMNVRPPQEDYFALMPKDEADKEREALKDQGGPEYHLGQMGFRGPRKLNAPMLPGIVRDPGHVLVQSKIARGLNLDGDDGSGKPAAGTCKHKNYESADGRKGIDNQFFTVAGCIAGWQGHKGFIMQYNNNTMYDGSHSMLIEISGIDDPRNDKSVTITWMYSEDPMAKGPGVGNILPDYSFRPTENPWYASYFSRTHGKIVNGVIISDPIDEFRLNLGGISGTPPELKLFKAGMRLEITPDGNLKGVVGGYMDWQRFASVHTTSNFENYFGYQAPAFYHALRREADGLKDPVTGECNGISIAYDVEGIPAFIVPRQQQSAMTKPE